MNTKKITTLLFSQNKATFIIQTVIPFIIPFIFEIPSVLLSIWIKIPIFILLTYIDLKLIFLIEQQNNNEAKQSIYNQAARYAYSNAYELNKRKRDYLMKSSYKKDFSVSKNVFPYDIHEYISEICKSFKNVVSQITKIDKEHISISFIYRYRYTEANNEDLNWRWITGKELTMKMELNDFVKLENSVYYFLINGANTVVFCNDKVELEKENHYYMSIKDNRHNNIGSIFSIKVMFSNNEQSFAEGILTISTYGERFVKNNNIQKINQLRCLLIDDLFPYYQRLLETELGMLYLKHIS